jgi:molybdate transport system ATP-binding protein
LSIRGQRTRAGYMSVDLEHVRVVLGGRPILRGVDWSIRPGQRWVLMGPNGGGKTLLLKLVAGDVWPTPARGSRRRYRLGAEEFLDPYGVKQEIAYLGAERQDRYEHYEWNHRVATVVGTGLHRTDIPLAPLRVSERAQIARLLARLRIGELAPRRFLTLSYGERRLVLLARALASRPRLLLLDEPFNGLDELNRERLRSSLQRLARSSLPWVLATHRPEEIPEAATHWCRLEAGCIRAHGRLTARARRALATGTRTPTRPRANSGAAAAPGHTASTLIELRDATVWRDGAAVLRSLSLAIRRGECWVVRGGNGAGKSSLVQLLYGDLGVAHGGQLRRAGIVPGVPLWQFQRRVGLVAPELQALHPRALSVVDVVASGLHASIGLVSPVSSRERARVWSALRRVGARGLAPRTLAALSYGQMRRILFARALVREPDILLLDEPYAGLDSHTRSGLRALVEQAVESGMTVVIATHHRDEWPRAATHELELVRGRARYCGPVRA